MANYIILKYNKLKGLIALKILVCLCVLTSICCCSKLLDVDAPYTSINKDNVFNTDATATSALTYIYSSLSLFNQDPDLIGVSTLYLYGGLLADEITLFDRSKTTYNSFYTNSLISNLDLGLWGNCYGGIFAANAAIDGLRSNKILTKSVQQQLLGEAEFIRAFYYFYLVNAFGDVPLVVSTDPYVNEALKREDTEKVYSQIIADLLDASQLLSDDFRSGDVSIPSTQRVRPSKWAAKALLSRVYLYHKDYSLAEQLATEIINQSSLFQLDSLDNVFLISSKESIWQLQNINDQKGNTGEGNLFILPSGGPNISGYPVYLSHNLIENFEDGDQRKVHWIDTVMDKSANVYYYAKKYKSGALTPPGQNTEYETVFRLGEQYLIRAEARIQLNRLPDSESDLNVIRNRAGLGDLINLTKDKLLEAVLHERQIELFTEWGHRWFDLKRTGRINEVMKSVTSEKGGTWNANWAFWPIEMTELMADHNLVQNPGY